jgi:hypothetical protein
LAQLEPQRNLYGAEIVPDYPAGKYCNSLNGDILEKDPL